MPTAVIYAEDLVDGRMIAYTLLVAVNHSASHVESQWLIRNGEIAVDHVPLTDPYERLLVYNGMKVYRKDREIVMTVHIHPGERSEASREWEGHRREQTQRQLPEGAD